MTASTFIIICDCPASLTSFIKETFLSPVYGMGHYFCKFSSVEFSHSVVSDSLQPHEPQHARPPCPSPTPSPPKRMSIELVMPSSHLILCHPLLLLPSIIPSIRVFSNESVLHIRWPKYWSSASTSVLPMNIQD